MSTLKKSALIGLFVLGLVAGVASTVNSVTSSQTADQTPLIIAEDNYGAGGG